MINLLNKHNPCNTFGNLWFSPRYGKQFQGNKRVFRSLKSVFTVKLNYSRFWQSLLVNIHLDKSRTNQSIYLSFHQWSKPTTIFSSFLPSPKDLLARWTNGCRGPHLIPTDFWRIWNSSRSNCKRAVKLNVPPCRTFPSCVVVLTRTSARTTPSCHLAATFNSNCMQSQSCRGNRPQSRLWLHFESKLEKV